MSSLPTWVLDSSADGDDRPFSLFGPRSTERVFEPEFVRREGRGHAASRPSRHAKAGETSRDLARLFGTLSLADLNEYREAAGRDPELDGRALRALNRAADRYFPLPDGETGGSYLRNTYIKYLSESADVAEITQRANDGFGPF